MKRRYQHGRMIYTVITTGRIFTFGSHRLAAKFYRRVERLYAGTDRKVEMACSSIITGRRMGIKELTEDRNARIEASATQTPCEICNPNAQ